MKVLICGGYSSILTHGQFAAHLRSNGVEPSWLALTANSMPDDAPIDCDGIIVVRNAVSHKIYDKAAKIAADSKLLFACVDANAWSKAEPILEQQGFFADNGKVAPVVPTVTTWEKLEVKKVTKPVTPPTKDDIRAATALVAEGDPRLLVDYTALAHAVASFLNKPYNEDLYELVEPVADEIRQGYLLRSTANRRALRKQWMKLDYRDYQQAWEAWDGVEKPPVCATAIGQRDAMRRVTGALSEYSEVFEVRQEIFGGDGHISIASPEELALILRKELFGLAIKNKSNSIRWFVPRQPPAALAAPLPASIAAPAPMVGSAAPVEMAAPQLAAAPPPVDARVAALAAEVAKLVEKNTMLAEEKVKLQSQIVAFGFKDALRNLANRFLGR